MSELGSAVTNAQLAAELREEAEAPGSMAKSGLILAAQRLEAKEEISDSKLLCAFEVYTRMRKARQAPGLECMRAAFKAAQEFEP